VRKDLNGVWVTGLPHTLTLITLGQGFVQEGEAVTAVKKQQKG
jgi:multidrug efflux system membrane fusion protein